MKRRPPNRVTAVNLTDAQLAEVRDLVNQTGYLPQSNKAQRLLAELERGPAEVNALVPALRQQLDVAGYLSQSKARQLVEAVEALRRSRAVAGPA